jgi:hypothetical protein
MNLLNELKTMMGHGCMPIFIARKATRIMQPTGIAEPVSPFVGNFLMQNGEALQKTCFEAASSSLKSNYVDLLRRNRVKGQPSAKDAYQAQAVHRFGYDAAFVLNRMDTDRCHAPIAGGKSEWQETAR